MKAIFGIGNCGTNIANLFAIKCNEEYKIITANTKDANILLPNPKNFSSPQEYENAVYKTNKIKKLFKREDEVIVVVGGGGDHSNSVLALLKQIADNPIDILYVVPDVSIIGEKNKLINVFIGNVLQEYTRSGIFNNMYLVANKSINDMLEGIPVGQYFDKINEMIVYLFDTLKKIEDTRPVFSSFQEYPIGVRIHTLGILDMVNNFQEKDLYEMSEISDITYHFVINKEELKTDKNLLKKLNQTFENRLYSETRVSYGIYETALNTNYSIYKKSTSKIQKIKK